VSWAGAFLLLAVAVLLLPPRDRRPGGGSGAQARPRRTAFALGRGGLLLAVVAAGAGCLVAAGPGAGVLLAAVCCPVTALAVRRAQHRPQRMEPDAAVPLLLDLAAAVLRSGRPLPDALTLAAPAARADTAATLARVAGLCRLGADPAQAWSIVPRDGPLAAVVPVAVRSATSGSKLAAAFERLAGELRAERSASAAVRAHRAGVTALAPLAACFLPSFVCLGVVPVVVGVARSTIGVVGLGP
jgi:Flp pilus assembly protein TadB